MTAEIDKLTQQLAGEQARESLPKFWNRIKKALSTNKITVVKLLRMYTVIEGAVKQIEAIAIEK